MTGLATQKQIDYIVTLANRRFGCQAKYLSQCRTQLGLSSFGVQRLTKVRLPGQVPVAVPHPTRTVELWRPAAHQGRSLRDHRPDQVREELTTMSTTKTQIVITEDVAETMSLANLGPRWSKAYEAAAERYNDAEADSPAEAAALADMESIEAAQESGEADYANRWVGNCERIADERGYDAHVILTGEHYRGTQTWLSEDATVEQEIWQAAHDATALPEGW